MEALQEFFNHINSHFGLTLADINNGMRITVKDHTVFHGERGEIVHINYNNSNVTVELDSGALWIGPAYFLSKE